MKSTEIITMNELNIESRNFKDTRLAKATERIAAIYKDAAKYAEQKNREIAKILADVAQKNAYEADGFKSVADYASTVFGIARQNAYALASAGKVYNDETANPELKAMTPSKLAEIAAVPNDKLDKALASGTIDHTTTQKALREFADKVKAESAADKPEVLDEYTVRPLIPAYTDEQTARFANHTTINGWDAYFVAHVGSVAPGSKVEIVNLPNGKVETSSGDEPKKATVKRKLYFNRGCSIVVEFYKYTAPKAKPAKAVPPKFTKEQLLAMLAEMEKSDS